MNRISFLLLLFLICGQLQAQQKYWIYLNEKNPLIKNSSPAGRMAHLQRHGLHTVVYSEWLNAASVTLPDSLSAASLRFPCLSHWEVVGGVIRPAEFSAPEDLRYDEALRQIHADLLAEAGYTGKGIRIGVIDAGFLNADKNRFLSGLVDNGQIKGFRNYIEPEDTAAFAHDYHGTRVLMHLAGIRPEKDQVRGMAWDALFYLARTDQHDREYRGEEDYWIAALEWMHKQGVRIVNSSLGYSDGYDDPSQDYLPENADGKSTAIARAATIAVKEKGMILVISAGNEGRKSFRVVSIPADARGVLSVGATTQSWPWTKQGYSSIGPASLDYPKPDIACFSLAGTSYSAPVIAGLAAAIWQARPDLSNEEVALWIRESGHLAPSPNNFLGYGVPDCRKILQRINGKPFPDIYEHLRTDQHLLSVRSSDEPVVVYHKSTEFIVLEEEVLRDTKNGVTIHRPAGARKSTIVYRDEILEITWDD